MPGPTTAAPASRHGTCGTAGHGACQPPTFVRFGPPVVGYSHLARAFRYVGWTEVTVDAAAVGEAALPCANLLLIRPKGSAELELGAEWLVPGCAVNRIRQTSCLGGCKAKQAHCRHAFAVARCRCPGAAGDAALAVGGRPLQPR